MKTDPVIDAVRKARCDISHELGNDPARLVAHYAELQARFKGQIIRGPGDDDSREDTAPERAAPSRSPAPTGSSKPD